MSDELAKKLDRAAKVILEKMVFPPRVGVILGSGLGDFTDSLGEAGEIPYGEIPHFPTSTVMGHRGKLVWGKISSLQVACLQGRVHCYEGYTPQEVAFPVRVLKKLGCSHVFLSNAAGAINFDYRPGDLVMITDHINLTGRNPLEGPNDESLGPRFPDMAELYHPSVQRALREVARRNDYLLREGVYAGVLGPSYETRAEVKMLRSMGADLVGMSTIFEAIAAHHCGLKVGAVSCISNKATGLAKGELRHEDIAGEALKVKSIFGRLIREAISHLQMGES